MKMQKAWSPCNLYFQKKNGARVKLLCAILENRAPLRRTDKIAVRHIEKVCAMAHMAHARIIPVFMYNQND